MVEGQTKQDQVLFAYIGQESPAAPIGKADRGIAIYQQNQTQSNQWRV